LLARSKATKNIVLQATFAAHEYVDAEHLCAHTVVSRQTATRRVPVVAHSEARAANQPRETEGNCQDSLARIFQEYEVSEDFPVVCQVRESVAELSFTNTLALFFLLLNIDTGLKHAVMKSETPMHQGKCANFFVNLRRHVIPKFMSKEACDTIRFAARCEDTWIVA
jgi:hypothetical protein